MSTIAPTRNWGAPDPGLPTEPAASLTIAGAWLPWKATREAPEAPAVGAPTTRNAAIIRNAAPDPNGVPAVPPPATSRGTFGPCRESLAAAAV